MKSWHVTLGGYLAAFLIIILLVKLQTEYLQPRSTSSVEFKEANVKKSLGIYSA